MKLFPRGNDSMSENPRREKFEQILKYWFQTLLCLERISLMKVLRHDPAHVVLTRIIALQVHFEIHSPPKLKMKLKTFILIRGKNRAPRS